jgi:hypothetical protein
MIRGGAEHDPMDVNLPVTEYNSEVRVSRIVEMGLLLTLRDCSWARGWAQWRVAGGLGDPLARCRQSERGRT